jgi:hypothetical protein
LSIEHWGRKRNGISFKPEKTRWGEGGVTKWLKDVLGRGRGGDVYRE